MGGAPLAPSRPVGGLKRQQYLCNYHIAAYTSCESFYGTIAKEGATAAGRSPGSVR